MIDTPGLYPGMDDVTYHADPVPGGSLSSTGARRILESPARFRWDQAHREGKRAFDVGHAVHTKVLGVGAPVVAYPDEHLTPSGNPSTKAATVAWEEEQREAGVTILSARDAALVDAMAEAVLAHPGARAVLEREGVSEQSAFAVDPETGIWTRARFDRLSPDMAADLKTTTGSASPAGFGSEAARRGYPIQEAHYLDTLEWIAGERPPMVFVVVEKHAPHLVAVHRFDDMTRIAAADLAARARRTYAECVAADDWPGYGDDTLTPRMPVWWFDHADDDAEMEVI